MDSISKMSEIISLLFDSIKNDNVHLMSMYAEFLDVAAQEWGESPLHVASRHGSYRVMAQLLVSKYRRFAGEKNNDGYTPLHLAAVQGDLAVVQVLVDFDSDLCLVEDSFSMIPLHAAVINGHGDVIRILIAACPQSVQKLTSRRENIFHLAAKNSQGAAFAVLLEKTRELNQGYSLLTKEDGAGNDILHIACSKKLVEIVRMLIPRSPSRHTLVPVNSMNNNLTPMDILYENGSWDMLTWQIFAILYEAGGLKGCSLPIKHQMRWTVETTNVLLVVLGIVSGVSFSTIYNLPAVFLKDNPPEDTIYQALDVLQYQLPPIFYLLLFNTTILMATMGAIIVLLWSLPFRAVVLFVTATVSIVYALLVHGIMPIFTVRFVAYKIPSSFAVGLLAAAFICFGAVAYFFLMYLALMLQSFLRTKPIPILPCLLGLMLPW